MNIKRIKKYILPIFLSLACVLTGCSQSNNNNGNNTTQKEEQSLEGTWKVKDLPETIKQHLEGTAVSSESIENIKKEFSDVNLTLTIKDNNAFIHYNFDVTKLYEQEYSQAAKFLVGTYKEFVDENIELFKSSKERNKHVDVTRENNKIDYTLKDGVLDKQNKTISFPETPAIDSRYLLSTTTYKFDSAPITYNYKIENNELVLTTTGTNYRTKKDATVVIKFTKEKN